MNTLGVVVLCFLAAAYLAFVVAAWCVYPHKFRLPPDDEWAERQW